METGEAEEIEIEVRELEAGDEAAFIAATIASAELHAAWIDPPRTPEAFREALRRTESPTRFQYLILAGAERGIAGTVTVGDIVRGNFQSAYLGYAAFLPFAGRGAMTHGLAAVVDRAFTEHGLHRVEANIQPANAASAALVRRLGFRLEGHSPRYLAVGGEWRDHDRWAVTVEEWSGVRPGF